MKSRTLRNSILVIIAVVIVAALAVLFGLFRTSSVAPQAKQALSPEHIKQCCGDLAVPLCRARLFAVFQQIACAAQHDELL